MPMTDYKGRPITRKALRRVMEKQKQKDPYFAAGLRKYGKNEKKAIIEIAFTLLTCCDSEEEVIEVINKTRPQEAVESPESASESSL